MAAATSAACRSPIGWTLSPRALVTVGGRYEYFDYLNDSALFSPSIAVAVSPADRTWVRAS